MTAGIGFKADFEITKHLQLGVESFAGVERKYSTEGTETKLKAEIGGGLKAPFVPLKPKVGIEKQIATNGKPDVQPAETFGDNPLVGQFGPASASPDTISIGLNIPFDSGITGGGGEIGLDVNKAVDYAAAVGDELNAGAQTVLNFLAPSINTGAPRSTPLPLPNPANHKLNWPN